MENSIEIALLNEQDIEGANNLYNRVYNSSRTAAQFAWEFKNGPAGEAVYVVARDAAKGVVVGMQCAIPLYLTGKGPEKILTAKSEDTLVDPSYRGLNIFEKMYALLFEECRNRGISYIWGFTYALKPFKKLGFEIPFHCQTGILPVNAGRSYKYLSSLNAQNSFSKKMKIFLLSYAAALKAAVPGFGRSAAEGYTLQTKQAGDLNGLLKEALEGGMLSLDQDLSFLNWRIYNNPYPQKYHQCSLEDKSGRMVAHAIYSISSEGLAYIIQVIISPLLHENACIYFTRELLRQVRHHKPFLIRHWGFDTNVLNRRTLHFLKKEGFTYLDMGISFVWKKLNAEKEIHPEHLFLSRMASQGSS